MVKIVEEEEGEQSETRSPSPPHTPSPRLSTSSSHQHNHNHHPSSPPSHPPSRPPGSPESSSSISSDHFHNFSSPLPTFPDHLELQQSPLPSPLFPNPLPSPPVTAAKTAVVNRLIRDKPPASVAKIDSGAVTGFAYARGASDYEGVEDGGDGGGERGDEAGRRVKVSSSSMLRRANKVIMLKKAATGLRWLEFVACLVSFSVMAADRNRGWALDSFNRYKEFRYSISVNVVGFVYSGLQGCSSVCQLSNGKHITRSVTWCFFDFTVDQILSYLLISASSSAATRVDDWILNWGKDKFPTMASASVGMSFLAFVAFALSSMISGYLLCARRST